MEPIREQQQHGGIRHLLEELKTEIHAKDMKVDTQDKRQPFKFPKMWTSRMNKANKARDAVLVFYLNIKGEMESPVLLPLYSGNMVVIRNKVHEVDPRAFWTVRIGLKQYKVMLIKEIDRRPVSNLDYDEIKRRGDSTDSDEFLIKAALRAQTAYLPQGMNKWVIIGIVVVIVGALGFFLFG